MRRLAVLALAGGAALAHAQSPGKKELAQMLLLRQQPGLEAIARNLVEQPALLISQEASRTLQSTVPVDQREAMARSIDADVKKYLEEAVPLVRERAVKAGPSTIGAALEDKFSEEELKQLITWFDSPVNKKYQQLGPEMQRGFVEKVVAESRPLIAPKIQALEQKVRATLGVPTPPAKAGAPTKPANGPARAASGAAP